MHNHSNHLKFILAGVVGFVVLASAGVLSWSNFPLLAILVICPLMMMLMMRGMDHGGSSNDETTDSHHGAHRH
jgi:hypothetical protein